MQQVEHKKDDFDKFLSKGGMYTQERDILIW